MNRLFTDLTDDVLADLARYRESLPDLKFFRCYRRFPGFRYTCWLRVSDWAIRNHSKIVASYAAYKLRKLALITGIQINPGTKIGAGLYIPHHGTIVINPGVIIGKRCYLSHNVTLGKAHTGKYIGVPTIGDDVFIGTGSTLLGKITVGDKSAIGVHSLVLENVESGTYVAGTPAQIISHKSSHQILGKE